MLAHFQSSCSLWIRRGSLKNHISSPGEGQWGEDCGGPGEGAWGSFLVSSTQCSHVGEGGEPMDQEWLEEHYQSPGNEALKSCSIHRAEECRDTNKNGKGESESMPWVQGLLKPQSHLLCWWFSFSLHSFLAVSGKGTEMKLPQQGLCLPSPEEPSRDRTEMVKGLLSWLGANL